MQKQRSRLAINGMGRIGRTLVRLLHQKKCLSDLKAVNDIMAKENLIYLLRYDSIRGMFPAEIISTPNGFTVDGHEITYSQRSEIAMLPWGKYGIDVVIEATGLFTHSSEASAHITSGGGRVLLTTYSKDIPSTVRGVNHHTVTSAVKVVSPGDCTVNCVAPVMKTIEQHAGIRSVHINVIQGYTTRQELIDSPYKGFRRGRAAAHSIIPFEVNIAPVLEGIFPSLKTRIESMSTRVPIPCGALADISFTLNQKYDAPSINKLFEDSATASLKGITAITYDPIVSSDIINNPHSGVIDGTLTKVIDGQHLKLMVWFDNEWGYANRLFDFLEEM